ncbi:hypothetical protein [Ovoidimarina sediminis]|uniref:hypothetical protein n=1 Tax=Ovoidimarina sediminis TaxID=3079856 RepID=UPI002907277E|nr:hypothetical protein [Rhodophyticola sp. MJ-SS7]MDU8944445.1 hypothetical protein [Rhodophyticola sp. MJ-SS7]
MTRSLPVSEGIVIAAPPGYCIDREASRVKDSGGAFVLLGSCAAISRNASAPRPLTPGLLTVTVSDAPVPLSDDQIGTALGRFFNTPEGRAILSRSGNANAVDILDTDVSQNALILHFTDESVAQLGLSPEHWRALFRLDGRLVTVAVSGFDDLPMTSSEGLATLRSMTDQIRAASAQGAS